MKTFQRKLISVCVASFACQAYAESTTESEKKEEKVVKPAEPNPTLMVEEMYVTTDKLGSASLQEMPVSVKLISGKELMERGIGEFIDFAGSIPSLQFQDLGPGDKEYIIRGTNSSGPSTVGVYFDETPITGSNAQDGGGRSVDIKLIDMQTVEIFNGPQGTQYGANSMSGLIRFVPVKPDAYEFSASVDVDVSTTEGGSANTIASGYVNIPLVEEKVGLRLVAWDFQSSGWIDQPRAIGGYKTEINDEDTSGGRIMLRYMPTDSIMLDFSMLRQTSDLGGSSRFTPKGTEYWGIDWSAYPTGVTEDDFHNTDLGESPWDEELNLASFAFNYELDFGTFTATTSTYERDIYFSFDASPLAFGWGLPAPWGIVQPQVRDISFTEVRFASDFDGKLQFFVGASYREEDNDWQSWGVTYDEFGHVTEFVPGPENDFFSNLDFATMQSTGNVIYHRYVDFELEQQALFGEATYEVNDNLILSFGARHFSSDQSSDEGGVHPAPEDPSYNSDSDSKVTGKFSAAYHADNGANIYATISQGFRVGGLNNSDSLAGLGIPVEYDPDILTNYELGYKTKFANELVTFNAALYRIDWKDIQVETTASSVPYIVNAGTAGINGLELSVNAYIGTNFYLEFAGSYTDAKLTEDQPVEDVTEYYDEGLDLGSDGDRIPNVPKIQFYSALTYATDVPWGELIVRGDLTHRGSADTWFDTDRTEDQGINYNYTLDSSTVASLRASLTMEYGWTATLYARNLTNKLVEYDAINSAQDPLAIIGAKPRTVGLRVVKDF